MTVRLNPYLSFRDDARPAMEFYRSVFGGQLVVTAFGDVDMAAMGMGDDPGDAQKVMHAQLETDDGLVLMASDTPSSMEHVPPAGISISLSGDDEARLRRWWEGLTDGGAVTMPLEQAPWGDLFGMCTDRYGTSWMVSISPPASA